MEDDLVPISALQHMLYCPRQCALIHVEQQDEDNVYTVEGSILHAKANSGKREMRDGIEIWRSVKMSSESLGVFGIADVVELREGNVPYPVEYKRGRPKSHRADEVQLCAQAICLEEMLAVDVAEGALFYGRTQRRKRVAIDTELRGLTALTAARTREMLEQARLPAPVYSKAKCQKCSLIGVCRPTAKRGWNVDAWMAKAAGG